MTFVAPKVYRDFYTTLYNADNIHDELIKHYSQNRKTMEISYTKFVMNFLKYLTWNIKNKLVKDFPRSKIEKTFPLKGFELNKESQFKTINKSFDFRPINDKSFKILGITTVYYNTDAPELIPETGGVLILFEEMLNFYNKKKLNEGSFGIIVKVNSKNSIKY